MLREICYVVYYKYKRIWKIYKLCELKTVDLNKSQGIFLFFGFIK